MATRKVMLIEAWKVLNKERREMGATEISRYIERSLGQPIPEQRLRQLLSEEYVRFGLNRRLNKKIMMYWTVVGSKEPKLGGRLGENSGDKK